MPLKESSACWCDGLFRICNAMGDCVDRQSGKLVTGLGLAFALVFPAVVTWFYFVVLAGMGPDNPIQQLTYSAGKIGQFSFPIVFMLLTAPRMLRLSRPRFDGLAYG